MSWNGALQVAQELLGRMGSGAEPAHVAQLFAESLEVEIAGDIGVLPWIGRKSGRRAVTDLVTDIRATVEPIRCKVHDVLAGKERAVILGWLTSELRHTGKKVETNFAIILRVADGEIVGFQMFEDSFAASQAALA